MNGSPRSAWDGGGLSVRSRIIEAALACVERYGLTKTTLGDVARQAEVSRATVYRAFPGGKDELFAQVADTEVAKLFSAVGSRLADAEDIADALVEGIHFASTALRRHGALATLLAHEPEVVYGNLAFEEANRLILTATSFAAPFLGRFLDRDASARVAEWGTRIILSYAVDPPDHTDLTDRTTVEFLVHTFVLPGVKALQLRSAPASAHSGRGEHAGAPGATIRIHQTNHPQGGAS